MQEQAITVVVPLYNGGEFIEDALNSIFIQTMKPAAVIVVDDGSSDDGPAIVEQIAKSRDIMLVHKENGGQSSARNLGISLATTPLIALLDQDDIWYPRHLELLHAPFQEKRCPRLGWVYSNVDQIDREGQMLRRSVLETFSGVEHPKRTLRGCLRTDMFVLPSACLIDHEAYEKVGGFDERLVGYEDDDLFLRTFLLDYENVYIPEPLSKWRIFPHSASHSTSMARSRIVFFRKWLGILGTGGEHGSECISSCLAPRFFKVALSNYRLALYSGDRDAQDVALETVRLLSPFVRTRVSLPARLLLPLSRFLRFRPIGRAAARTVPIARVAYNLISR
jgi:glycosyltransferase involved in cell wall biosynthesis